MKNAVKLHQKWLENDVAVKMESSALLRSDYEQVATLAKAFGEPIVTTNKNACFLEFFKNFREQVFCFVWIADLSKVALWFDREVLQFLIC